jgi:hypothetical protein
MTMNILGIHLSSPSLRVCLLKKKHRSIQIKELREIFSLKEPHVKQLYNKNFKGKVVSGLPAKDFMIRRMEVKVSDSQHAEEAIAFQSEALSYFDLKEALLVPWIRKKEKEKTEALLFTIPKERFSSHLNELKEWGIDPDLVSTIPSALCRFIDWKFPDLKDAFIIDLGSKEITCALLEKGDLKKSFSIKKGTDCLLAALHEDRKKNLLKKEIEGAAKQIDLLLLKSNLNPHLSKELNDVRQELARVHHSFDKGLAHPVIFTGITDTFIHFPEALIDFSKNPYCLTLEEQKFAISIGLALEQTSSPFLQLRQGEFFPQKNWARMGLYALLLFSISILLSFGFLSYGLKLASSRKQTLADFLQTPNRKNLIQKGSIESQINQWIHLIEENKQDYRYILQGPKVSQVLSWLSSHPLLVQLKNEGDPIQIEEMKYQLASYPKIDSTDPFLIKVELHFRFKHLVNARRFHEALRKGDALVDPEQEIIWDASADIYRTSFFTKNQGFHVS